MKVHCKNRNKQTNKQTCWFDLRLNQLNQCFSCKTHVVVIGVKCEKLIQNRRKSNLNQLGLFHPVEVNLVNKSGNK